MSLNDSWTTSTSHLLKFKFDRSLFYFSAPQTPSFSSPVVESDPGVFTELISKMGAQGVEVTELWSTDSDSLANVAPVCGLIFLSKWEKEPEDPPRVVDEDFHSKGIFFANQVINNACATQALISVLLNIDASQHPGFELGSELTSLKEFTADFPPDMRGLAIGNSDAIRTVHNSFHPPQSLVAEDKDDEKSGDAFHFVAYIPAAGGLYELDGLKPGPIRICDCEQGQWLEKAAEAVNARIAKYSETEQRFNLMAVVKSRLDLYKEQLEEAKNAGLDEQVRELTLMVETEERKRQRWTEENLRRRTDFTPFAFNLLKSLAADGQLQGLVSTAEEQHKLKLQQRQASSQQK